MPNSLVFERSDESDDFKVLRNQLFYYYSHIKKDYCLQLEALCTLNNAQKMPRRERVVHLTRYVGLDRGNLYLLTRLYKFLLKKEIF